MVQHIEFAHEGALLVDDIKAIEMVAEVRQLKTMADFSINVTLNIPETCKEQCKNLIDWQGKQVRMVIVLEQ